MTDCYYATKDWRACKKEVSHPFIHHASSPLECILLILIQMEIFRECWKRNGNEKRTDSKNS